MSNFKNFLMQRSWLAAVIVLAATAIACSGGEAPEPEEMEMAEPEAAPEPMDQPRVFLCRAAGRRRNLG